MHADEEPLWLISSTEKDLATQTKVPGAGVSLRGKIRACYSQGPGLGPLALLEKTTSPHQRTDSPLKRTLTKIITSKVTISLLPLPISDDSPISPLSLTSFSLQFHFSFHVTHTQMTLSIYNI